MEELICKFYNLYKTNTICFELDEIYSLLVNSRTIEDYDRIKFIMIPTKQINLTRPYSIQHDYSASYIANLSLKKGIVSIIKNRFGSLEKTYFDPAILKDYREMDITQFNLSHKGTIGQITGFKQILEFVLEKLEDDIG